MSPTLVIAHRGLHADGLPENSTGALRAALDAGADGVEFDVRATSDGELVLHHDPDVDGRAIEQTPGGELPNLARLAEALSALSDDAVVDVEIKHHGYEAAALELARRHVRGDRLLVTSFYPRILAALRALDPGLRIGLLVSHERPLPRLRRLLGPRPTVWIARRLGADVLAPHHTLITPGLVRAARDAGLPLYAWTANDAPTLDRLLAEPQVEAVITDDPALALERRGIVGQRTR